MKRRGGDGVDATGENAGTERLHGRGRGDRAKH